MKLKPLQCWGFAWDIGKKTPFVTSIIACSRKDCQNQVAKMLGMSWKRVYRKGGRTIRCTVTPNV